MMRTGCTSFLLIYQIYFHNRQAMQMRYYPKQVKTKRIVYPEASDRGKKHYWNLDRGDYGFYLSEDKKQMQKLRKTKYNYSHRPSHHRSNTYDNYDITRMLDKSKSIQQEFRQRIQIMDPQVSPQQQKKTIIETYKPKSRIGTICTRNIIKANDGGQVNGQQQLSLPRIQKSQSKSYSLAIQPQQINIRQDQPIKEMEPTRRYQQQKRQSSNRRHKTEQQYDYYTIVEKNRWEDGRFRSYGSHIKYSPTFVSSLENPLPLSFVHSPGRCRTYEYQISRRY